MKINYSLLQRLAAKKANKYVSPFQPRPMWGGAAHKSGGHWLRWGETPETWSELIGAAHKVVGLRHTGWYVDSYQSESQFGIVRAVRMKGGVRYLACISDPYNGDDDGNGPCWIETHSDGSPMWYETKAEAARAADRAAEASAEKMREYDEGWQARNSAEEAAGEARQTIKRARDEARELIEGIRESTLAPSLCARMRREVARLRGKSADAWETLRESLKRMEELKEYV